MRRWTVVTCLTLLTASVTACGSRTGLPLGGGGTSATAPGGPGGRLMSNGCTAALQKGAPTPMLGYCPTRAGLTPVTAPRSPAVAWRTTLVPDENPENYLPFETVVDSSGRAYVGVYSSPESPTTSFEIVALHPDGSAAWKSDLSTGSGSYGAPGTAPAALAI